MSEDISISAVELARYRQAQVSCKRRRAVSARAERVRPTQCFTRSRPPRSCRRAPADVCSSGREPGCCTGCARHKDLYTARVASRRAGRDTAELSRPSHSHRRQSIRPRRGLARTINMSAFAASTVTTNTSATAATQEREHVSEGTERLRHRGRGTRLLWRARLGYGGSIRTRRLTAWGTEAQGGRGAACVLRARGRRYGRTARATVRDCARLMRVIAGVA